MDRCGQGMDLALVALGRKSPPGRCGFGKGLRSPRSEESCPRPSCEVVLGLGVLGVGLLLGSGRRGVGFLGWGRL